MGNRGMVSEWAGEVNASSKSILRGDVSQYINEKKVSLELRGEGIGRHGQLACFQSACSVLDSMWTLASDLLLLLLMSWWFSSPDSLIHSTEFLTLHSSAPMAWPSMPVAKLLLERPVCNEARPTTWHVHDLQKTDNSLHCYSGLWGAEHMVARQQSWKSWKGRDIGYGSRDRAGSQKGGQQRKEQEGGQCVWLSYSCYGLPVCHSSRIFQD